MAIWTEIDHITITVNYTLGSDTVADSLYIKTVVPTDDSLRIRTITVTDCEPYVDCDNKHESLESLFKRAVVKLPDGTYALQVCYGLAP